MSASSPPKTSPIVAAYEKERWFGRRGLATALFALLVTEQLAPDLGEFILHIAANTVRINRRSAPIAVVKEWIKDRRNVIGVDVFAVSDCALLTAETNPATRRRKTRPVAGCQAPWCARSPDSWCVPWHIGPQGQPCNGRSG